MSSFNINFTRFDRASIAQGFEYKATENPKELEYQSEPLPLSKLGFNVQYNVQNYTAEAVLLGGNLNTTPARISSLRNENARFRDDINNFVLITIYATENSASLDPKKRTTLQRKIEVRVPGRMLNQGSVFISELDCYLMTESNVDATRGLIAKDTSPHANWESINIPSSMIRQDPPVIYVEYKDLVQYCIDKTDYIQIRIGVDLEHDIIPPIVKNFRVAILDSYFIPFSCYKLVYDPTLSSDDFIIENLHLASKSEFRGSFNQLNQVGSVYLEHEEYQTMFGKYFGMAIFANEKRYTDYVFKRKSHERFKDEQLYLAVQSGDPLLRENIQQLEAERHRLQEILNTKDSTLTEKLDTIKTLKSRVKELEDSIDRIRNHHDSDHRPDVVVLEMENSRLKLALEERRITHEQEELRHKETLAPSVHKATMWKTTADMMKSSWGIVTAVLGGILSVVALCKKYGIKLVVAG